MATRRFKRSGAWQRIFRGLLASPTARWRFLAFVGVLFLWGAGTILWWSKDLPDPQNIRDGNFGDSTKIYDSTGTHLLYEIGETRRTWKELSEISPYLKDATLAAEDSSFYSHHGIDITGVIRGVVLKPLTGQRAQGGSTITQQLIKNSFLTPERTIRRKAKEAVLALELEQRFSKDEILTMYLNAIPYGSRSYGIEAASQIFFGKPATSLSLAESAALAALPQAPSYYSPYGSHFEDLKARQEYVLDRMATLGKVSSEEASAAKQEELSFLPQSENIQAPHFVLFVKEQLDAEYGEQVVERGGLTVTTTLDARLQSVAEEVLKEQTSRLNSLGASNGAIVATNPKNGDILAMSGSLDYFNEEIDGNVNVAIRHRSPGSSIKPIIYTAAFAKGYTPETILIDAETDFGQGYTPKNYNLRENGPVTMRQALANSLNIPAVKTLYLVGVNEAVALAQKLGLTSLNDPERYGLSLVLGGGEVRLMDMVSAYGVLAAEGVKYPQRSILKVEHQGNTLFDASEEDTKGEEVLDPNVARTTTNVISDNGARALVFGTNTPLTLGSRPVAAKTGTTQEFRDGWTIGYTPSLTAGVWVGNNDNSPMNQKSDSGLTAAPVWNAFMRRALEGTPIEQFTQPQNPENLRHAVMRGELLEVKGKWVEDAKTLYTPECPVAEGEPRTFKEIHSILYYVRRINPLGDPPAQAEADPQFVHWEEGVRRWAEKNREESRADATKPIYTQSLPTPVCDISGSEELPKVTITEPNTTILRESPTTVRVSVDSQHPVKEVKFILDGETVATRGPDDDLAINLTFDKNVSGRRTLLIQAITENNLIGRAHRTFILNPDDTPPTVTLHTPQNGLALSPNKFPQQVKITATDSSGIDYVDVLYRKKNESGSRRIGQTNTIAPTAPNRYEVTWNDSPGTGEFEVYAIVYDKTGNFTETSHHTITIQ